MTTKSTSKLIMQTSGVNEKKIQDKPITSTILLELEILVKIET
jgi:hypothetical protein